MNMKEEVAGPWAGENGQNEKRIDDPGYFLGSTGTKKD